MMVQMATTIGCGIGASNCAEHIENQNAVSALSFAFYTSGSAFIGFYWVLGESGLTARVI